MQKHIKKTKPIIYGHQKLILKGIRPRTKKKRSKNYDVGVDIFDANNDDDMKTMIEMDLPGRFPITSGISTSISS